MKAMAAAQSKYEENLKVHEMKNDTVTNKINEKEENRKNYERKLHISKRKDLIGFPSKLKQSVDESTKVYIYCCRRNFYNLLNIRNKMSLY